MEASCFLPGRRLTLKRSCTATKLLSKECRYGHDRLERPPHVWPDFDARPHVYRGSRRTNQFQPAPQGVPFAAQTALVLSRLQSQRGTVRNCEGLRIREGSIRAVQRRGTRQDRAFLGTRDGDTGIREAGGDGSFVLRFLVLRRAGRRWREGLSTTDESYGRIRLRRHREAHHASA